MSSEPWCWHPDQIARLTVEQAENIVRAQSRRVERMTADRQPGAPSGPPPPEIDPDKPFPREILVAGLMDLGRSRAQAEAEYDRQTALWEASRGKPGRHPEGA